MAQPQQPAGAQPQPVSPPQPQPQVAGPQAMTYVLEARPRLLVTPDGGAYLVLAAGPVKVGPRLAWSVAYVAAPDRGVATAPGTDERLRRAADALFRSQRLLAELAGVDLFSVNALFGAPGERGVSLELTYARGADAWHASPTVFSDEVAETPMLPARLDRDPPEESSAVEVALRFLEHVDQREFDAAWDLSSAVVKATMSRVSFEQQLGAVAQRDAAAQRQEAFHSFAPGAFIPGASFEIVFERPQALEAIVLRLDDDMSWRIAALRTFTAADTDDGGMTAAAGDAVNKRRELDRRASVGHAL
jgi:hypothetical protein